MEKVKRGVTRIGPKAGARDVRERPVRTLRVRYPACLLIMGAVAAVVALLAATQIIITLAGAPPHTPMYVWVHLPQPVDPWARPEIMLASALLAALGLTLAVGALVPARGDWLALREEGLRPADGVPESCPNGGKGGRRRG